MTASGRAVVMGMTGIANTINLTRVISTGLSVTRKKNIGPTGIAAPTTGAAPAAHNPRTSTRPKATPIPKSKVKYLALRPPKIPNLKFNRQLG
jgi:hypothetical protein